MIKAIIVDDEPAAVESLQIMLTGYCQGVSVKGTAGSALEAVRQIDIHNPDLVFLDIDMPNSNGFEFLNALPTHKFQVIFVTAYDKYALNAIKFQPVDYLLKPVDIDDLKAAVAKVKRPEDESKSKKLSLPSADGTVYVPVEHIIRIEANGSYTNFYLMGGIKHMVSTHMKEYEDQLPSDIFFRCHHSHIINMQRVTKFLRQDGNRVIMEDGSKVDVSRRKKELFLLNMKRIMQ